MFNVNKYLRKGISVFDHTQIRKERILIPQMDNCGYYHYRLTKETGKYVLFKVHRLVAKHFLPDYSEDLTVNHKNFDKSDNRSENLEMMTRLENLQDAINNKEKTVFFCNETKEKFISFKAWCRRNNIVYSRYRFKKSIRDKTKYYNTNYTFAQITIEG